MVLTIMLAYGFDRLEVPRGRRHAPKRSAHDRLGDEGRDGAWASGLEGVLEFGSLTGDKGCVGLAGELLAVCVASWDAVDIGEENVLKVGASCPVAGDG